MILLYSGFGLESLNISFVDSMTYNVSKEQGEYLLSTFPTSFSITDSFITDSSINDTAPKNIPEVVSSVVLDDTEIEDTSKKRKRKIKE